MTTTTHGLSKPARNDYKQIMQFDHEKLEVYRLELQFISWVTELFDNIGEIKGKRLAEVCDQLERASLSALLNTAEGNGKRQGLLRAKLFDDARGSATECAACLDALVAKRARTKDQVQAGKEVLFRIVGMLSKLVQRFEGDGNAPAIMRDEPLD